MLVATPGGTQSPAPSSVPLLDVSPAPASEEPTERRGSPAPPSAHALRERTLSAQFGELDPFSQGGGESPLEAPFAGNNDDWISPYATRNLHPSDSIRSQRNWNEFDGKPVTPLPSPSLHPHGDVPEWLSMSSFEHTQHGAGGVELERSPSNESSKTAAFFDAPHTVRPPPPPKPPQNTTMGRSASSRMPASAAVETRRQRQRAVSSPHDRERLWVDLNTGPSLAPPPTAETSMQSIPPTSQQHTHRQHTEPAEGDRQADRESRARLGTESPSSKRPGMSRHIHGPSINVTRGSIYPALLDKTEQSRANARSSDVVTAEFLSGAEVPSLTEDETHNTVGPYRVLETLGVGAFSKVLRAQRSEHPCEVVALKMIATEPWQSSERMRVSWIREVEVLKHIMHPSIVRFLAAFRTPAHYALVLEALHGGELFDLLAHHQSEIAQREWLVRRIFSEVTAAVGWMHSINLVHRDIKLENIMLTKPLLPAAQHLHGPEDLGPIPVVKVSDFGLARFLEPNTLLETRCGSEEYAAPELIIGKQYDGRQTDAWALGVVLYALITGALPFIEDPSAEVDACAQQPPRERPSRAPLMTSPGSNGSNERENKARKAHLLRIAKGELHWPAHMNELAQAGPSADYAPHLRLTTPCARHVVARFLRRDATKRAQCWDLWQEPWLREGSFAIDEGNTEPILEKKDDACALCVAKEPSAAGQRVPLPIDPGSAAGQRWIQKNTNARHREVSVLARRELA